jgi:hypothetical protein
MCSVLDVGICSHNISSLKTPLLVYLLIKSCVWPCFYDIERLRIILDVDALDSSLLLCLKPLVFLVLEKTVGSRVDKVVGIGESPMTRNYGLYTGT